MMGSMPKLDRRLALTIRGEGRRDVPGQEGKYVEGVPTFDGAVWAMYMGLVNEPEPTEAGVQVEAMDTFHIRYRSDLAAVDDVSNRVEVVDDMGRAWVVKSVREIPEPRRRFQELRCIREDPA